MKGLFKDSSAARKKLTEWERLIIESFEQKMTNKDQPFPCIPATIGFSTNQLRYGFIGEPAKETSVDELAALLKDFTEQSKEFGNYTSLIVFYQVPEDIKEVYTVADYEQIFWQQLNKLTEIDEKEWPDDIPTDPHAPVWEYCFHGERYFMYCATPAHQNRQSRHFDTMMLAITPRWVLQAFNKSEARAVKIKDRIRERLNKYDTAEIHPHLNSYGAADNYEWKQYFLHDDDSAISKCPFHRILKWIH